MTTIQENSSTSFRWPIIGTFALALILAYIWPTLRSIILMIRRIQARKKALEGIQGPTPHWLWGNLKDHPGVGEKGLTWIEDLVVKYPKYMLFHFGPLRPVIGVYHPETVKTILRTSEPKPLSEGGGYGCLKEWLGDGLLLSSGQKWFRNRKMLTPGFHFDVLKPYVNVYNEAVGKLINKFEKGSSSTKSIEIYKHVGLCTLDVMLRCAFNSKTDIQNEENKYVNSVNSMADLILDRAFKPYLYPDSIYNITINGRRFNSHTDYAHKIAYDLITKRKKALNDSVVSETKRFKDFLDILILARDEHGNGLSDEDIRAEVDTFLFEGHDTTASAILWILYSLAKHPDIQERCYEEVCDVINDSTNAYITWEHLQEMPYLTQCIKEGLRLFSPVPLIARELTEPIIIGGHTIPAGTFIDINIYALHHNPEVWGDDHRDYKPERFHQDNMVKMDSHAFIPFSAGPRNCIGQNFAMNEIKVVVAKMVQHFKLSVDKSHTPNATLSW